MLKMNPMDGKQKAKPKVKEMERAKVKEEVASTAEETDAREIVTIKRRGKGKETRAKANDANEYVTTAEKPVAQRESARSRSAKAKEKVKENGFGKSMEKKVIGIGSSRKRRIRSRLA